MRYAVAGVMFMPLFYLLSFSRYNWQNNNRRAAVGAAVLGITAFGLAYFVLFAGNYEM